MAHRDGGGREAGDLVHLCHGHHVLYDAGWFWIEMTEGGPVFHFRRQGRGNGSVNGSFNGSGNSNSNSNSNGSMEGMDRERRWPVPPHLRPNPHESRATRWVWSRPPPE